MTPKIEPKVYQKSVPSRRWIPDSPYSTSSFYSGYFFSPSRIGANGNNCSVTTCRNHFLPWTVQLPKNKRKRFALTLTKDAFERLAAFMYEWETVLGFRRFVCWRVEGSKIHNWLVVFTFDRRWVATPLRISFLAYLVKLGISYKPGTPLKDFINKPPADAYMLPNDVKGVGGRRSQKEKILQILEDRSLASLDETLTWENMKGVAYGSGVGFIESNF